MKKILFISIFTMLGSLSSAQVLIGTTTASSTSVSVEFGTEFRGILLEPIDLPAAAAAGTIIFDDNSGSMRYHDGSAWSPVIPGGATNTVTSFTTTGSVIINGTNSNTDGILIIEETNRALVLPSVSGNVFNIENPTTGLMFYDPAFRAVMVYNGNGWVAY